MKYDVNDEYGIKLYGKRGWAEKCAYENEKAEKVESFFAEVSSKESMERLFALIEDLVGEKLEFTYTVCMKRHNVDFVSKDLSSKPFISLAWCDFRVGNFSSGLNVDEVVGKDGKMQVKGMRYWASVHFCYRHIDGGENGAKIASASYMNGKWTVVPEAGK